MVTIKRSNKSIFDIRHDINQEAKVDNLSKVLYGENPPVEEATEEAETNHAPALVEQVADLSDLVSVLTEVIANG